MRINLKLVIFLQILVIIGLLGGMLLFWVQALDERGVRRNIGAQRALFADLVAQDCTHIGRFQKAAAERGWRVEQDLQYPWDDKPKTTQQILRIHIEPPMPFAKDPGLVVFFDQSGCYIRRR